jgi:hypothetical protein
LKTFGATVSVSVFFCFVAVLKGGDSERRRTKKYQKVS